MYVHSFSYLVNELEIRWLYLSPIEKKKINSMHQFNLKQNGVQISPRNS